MGMDGFKRQIKQLLLVSLIVMIGVPIAVPSLTYAATTTTWTTNAAADDMVAWNGIAWSPQLKRFVAVGGGGTVNAMTSTDGITWTPLTLPATGTMRDVTWSPELGIFVIVGTNTAASGMNALTSSDGITWTAQSLSLGVGSTIVWSPEQHQFVVAVATASLTATSPDGITWTSHTGSMPINATGIAWSADDNRYVVASASSPTGRMYSSPDGITWTQQSTSIANFQDIVYSKERDLFVTVGTQGITTSPDGITWTSQTTPLTDLSSVTWSAENGEFVAAGWDGGIVTSPDGIMWTQVSSPTTNRWTKVTWSPELSRYVAVASTGTGRTMVGLVSRSATAPLNLAATASGSNQISLSWTEPSFDGNAAITGYQIERRVSGGSFSILIANTNSTATAYQDTNLTPGTTYGYRIYAINAVGESVASNITSATTSVVAGAASDASKNTLTNTGVNQRLVTISAATFIILGTAATFKRRGRGVRGKVN